MQNNAIKQNTNKKKGKVKKNVQTKGKKQKSTKSKTKHGINFVLANSLWPWVLPWNVVDLPSGIPLRKTDFSLCLLASIVNSFWVRSRNPCLFLIISDEILLGSNLYIFCVL